MEKLEAPGADEKKRKRLNELKVAIGKLDPQIEYLVNAVSAGNGLASVEARLRDLERERQQLRAEKVVLDADINGDRGTAPTREQVQEWFSELLELLTAGDIEKQRELVSCLVGEVEAQDKSMCGSRCTPCPHRIWPMPRWFDTKE